MRDPQIGVRLRPGASARFKTSEFETDIAINSSGVRDSEIGPKPAGERRIVVLGDSIVLSVQVQAAETFCARLQLRLNAQRGLDEPAYRVINAGVQGYGPVEALSFFEHVASRFEADVVLVAVYVGNDADGGARLGDRRCRVRDREGRRRRRPRRHCQAVDQWPLWMRRLVRRSMVLQTVRLRTLTLLERYSRVHPIDRALTMYLPDLPPDMDRGLAVTRECVRRIAEAAAGRGARTGIMLVPARFQIADDDYGQPESHRRRKRPANSCVTRRPIDSRAALGGLGLPMRGHAAGAAGRVRSGDASSCDRRRTSRPAATRSWPTRSAGFLRDSGLLHGAAR